MQYHHIPHPHPITFLCLKQGFARKGGKKNRTNVCELTIGNIVIIGVLVAAYVGYSAYRQKHQGGGITAGKKRA